MTAPLALIRNDSQVNHHAPEHPERPQRVAAILERIAADPELSTLPWLEPGPSSRELPLLVHTLEQVRRVEFVAQSGGGWFDSDTYCTGDSFAIALDAVACAARAVDAVMSGEALSVFAIVRPPGHHATPSVPMGFCLFNNAAVAVRRAQAAGATRVAVIDIDVHHGNGSQDIFHDDATVLYCSVHQFPWYPGTGLAEDRGAQGEEGPTIVNVPVPAGTDGDTWLQRFDELIAPAVDAFAPDLVVVSAGYDAHDGDPLADLRLADTTYREIARRVRGLAEKHAQGRSVWLLEGGYRLDAIAASVAAQLHVLGAPATQAQASI